MNSLSKSLLLILLAQGIINPGISVLWGDNTNASIEGEGTLICCGAL